MIQSIADLYGIIAGIIPRSPKWPSLRKKHLKKFPKCMACGGTKNITVHHILPFNIFHELELDPANLITLCEGKTMNCHLSFGHLNNFKTKYNVSIVEDAAYLIKRFGSA